MGNEVIIKVHHLSEVFSGFFSADMMYFPSWKKELAAESRARATSS
jgi:hypothetical protein